MFLQGCTITKAPIVVQEIFWHPPSHSSAQFIPIQTNFHLSKRQVDGWLAKCLVGPYFRGWHFESLEDPDLRLFEANSCKWGPEATPRSEGRHFIIWFQRIIYQQTYHVSLYLTFISSLEGPKSIAKLNGDHGHIGFTDPLEIWPELTVDNPFDSSQRSWISRCPGVIGFYVAL